MKHKKKKAGVVPDSPEQQRKRYLLNRRKALREQAKLNDEQIKNEFFDLRMESAASKKAPLTQRTRGYYRFRKSYPSTVSPDGFRDNSASDKKHIGKFILTFCIFILCFCLAFCVTETGKLLAAKPLPATEPPAREALTELKYRVLRIDPDTLHQSNAEEIIRKLEAFKCDTVLLDYKNDEGYICFPSNRFSGTPFDRAGKSSEDTARLLQKKGYHVWGRICCFKDTCAVKENNSLGVRKNTETGDYWKDSNGSGWLNPWSSDALSYLYDVISEAANSCFDALFLTDLSLPSYIGTTPAYFSGKAASDLTEREIIDRFSRQAIKHAGKLPIYFLRDLEFFSSLSISEQEVGEESFLSQCAGVCTDVRLFSLSDSTEVGGHTVLQLKKMPFVLALEASKLLVDRISVLTREIKPLSFVCIENNPDLQKTEDAVRLSGANGIVIW